MWQRGLAVVVQKDIETHAAFTQWVLPLQPPDLITLCARAACKTFTGGGPIFYLTQLTCKNHIFSHHSLPCKKYKVISTVYYYHLFYPPTKFLHAIKCYIYTLHTPNLYNSFHEPRKGQFLSFFIYVCMYIYIYIIVCVWNMAVAFILLFHVTMQCFKICLLYTTVIFYHSYLVR